MGALGRSNPDNSSGEVSAPYTAVVLAHLLSGRGILHGISWGLGYPGKHSDGLSLAKFGMSTPSRGGRGGTYLL